MPDATTSPASAAATPVQPPAPDAPGEQVVVRRRGRGTVADLLRSLLVILAIVGLLVLIVPRPKSIPDQKRVDVGVAAAQATRTLGFPVSVPQGLPESWLPRQAEVREGQGKGVSTWRLTYLTPAEHWASVVQAGEYAVPWENREVSYGKATGTRDIDGVSWTVRNLPERSYLTLVHRAPGDRVTTIVTCACDDAELVTLVRSLEPAPGR